MASDVKSEKTDLKATFSILSFGAKGDGVFLNTTAEVFNEPLKVCHHFNKGKESGTDVWS